MSEKEKMEQWFKKEVIFYQFLDGLRLCINDFNYTSIVIVEIKLFS